MTVIARGSNKSVATNVEKLRKWIAVNSNAVKTYRRMCEILGEEELFGNSKPAQLKRWRRYFDFERDGQKFIIKEIYDLPMVKQDDKIIYSGIIELLLMYELSEKRAYTNEYTANQLYRALGMIGDNYISRDVSKSISYVQNSNPDIMEWEIFYFLNRANAKLHKILFRAMNSMVSRRLLDYTEERVICEKEDGRTKTFRRASSLEIKEILRIERQVLEDMGLERIPFANRLLYYENVNEVLKEELGYEFTYKRYRLRCIALHTTH